MHSIAMANARHALAPLAHHIYIAAMTKERLSVSFDAPAMTWLRKEAKRLGISIGELLRRLIAQLRDSK